MSEPQSFRDKTICRGGPPQKPDWVSSLTSEVVFIGGDAFEDTGFYTLQIGDETETDEWIVSDTFCDLSGTDYAND